MTDADDQLRQNADEIRQTLKKLEQAMMDAGIMAPSQARLVAAARALLEIEDDIFDECSEDGEGYCDSMKSTALRAALLELRASISAPGPRLPASGEGRDYAELLVKYIGVVLAAEGVDFIHSISEPPGAPHLSEQERVDLQRCADEAARRHRGR